MHMSCKLHAPAALSSFKSSVAHCVSPERKLTYWGRKNCLSLREIGTYDRSAHSLVIIPTQ